MYTEKLTRVIPKYLLSGLIFKTTIYVKYNFSALAQNKIKIKCYLNIKFEFFSGLWYIKNIIKRTSQDHEHE